MAVSGRGEFECFTTPVRLYYHRMTDTTVSQLCQTEESGELVGDSGPNLFLHRHLHSRVFVVVGV